MPVSPALSEKKLAFKGLYSGIRSICGAATGKLVWGGPRMSALILSKECNSRCVMCWYHSPLIAESEETRREPGGTRGSGVFMDYQLAEKIICELAALGTYRVVLGGHGEPTLHPQFDRMLDLVIRNQMRPYVISNGLTLDPKRAEQWSRKRAYFRFSLHAGDVKTWLRVHPESTAGQFETLCRAIKRMAASRTARVAILHVIQKANFRHLTQMIEHAHQLRVREVLFFPVRTDGCLPSVVLSPTEESELAQTLDSGLRLATRVGIETNLGRYLGNYRYLRSGILNTHSLYRRIPCYVGWTYTEFDINGEMHPCENSEIVMGYAGRQSLRDMWFSTRYGMFRHSSRMMPRRRGLVDGCQCKACSMARFNINIHQLLHLKSFLYNDT